MHLSGWNDSVNTNNANHLRIISRIMYNIGACARASQRSVPLVSRDQWDQ
jgi:uncharacterized ferredoxin-like protein